MGRWDARSMALAVLDAVRATPMLATAACRKEAARRELGAGESALANELALGVLRLRRYLDHVLAGAVTRGLPERDGRLMDVLRLAVYELLFIEKVPVYATGDRYVELARRTKGERVAKFVNAVLRKVSGRDPGELAGEREKLPVAVRLSYPDFLVEGARRGFGEGWEEELGALNLPAEIAVRVNTRRTTAEGLAERLRGEGLHPREVEGVPGALVLPSGEPPYRTLAFAEGEFWPQDVGSQRVARLAVPGASERLLDLCAGSGTKSFLAASDAGTGARVMAVDVSEAKVAALAARKERLGFPEVEALACDARALPFPDGAFDVVLLDAPCTGAGTVRRHPELKWRRQEGDVGAAAARQGELLAAAARLVRPGGRLVYAVCSFLPEEGKEVVGRFLAARPEFAGAPSDFACLPAGGREAWQGFVVTAGRSGRLMRPREEGGDAFYAAVLVRRDATDGNH